MRRSFALISAIALVIATGASAAETAKVCKNAAGAVIKCPAPSMMMAGGKPHCHDPKTGVLEKCTMPGSVPNPPETAPKGN